MKRTDHFVLSLLVISLAANVALALLLRGERGSRSAAGRLAQAEVLPRVGARLQELRLLALDGSPAQVQTGSQGLPIVAYVLSPTCKWCEMNRRNIESLASQVRGRYRVIGISTTASGLVEYRDQTATTFPLFSVDPQSPHPDFPLGVTPETLVFSSRGVYLRGWGGAYVGETKKDVSTFLGVALPN